MTASTAGPDTAMGVSASRRRLALDGVAIIASVVGFGLVYGVSTRQAGFSLVEAVAMSVLVFAGASQFAAVGALTAGVGWPGILLITAFLNARHLLYSAALAPWTSGTSRRMRTGMAFVLTDEAFALSIAHFRRIHRLDLTGYWYAAIVTVFVPWNLATIAGSIIGGAVGDPAALGLDVIFPAAMAGLAIGLATGRREVVAACAGAAIAVPIALVWATSGGIIVGGLVGPAIGMLVPDGGSRRLNPVPLGRATDVDAATAGVDDAGLRDDPGRDPDIGVAP